MAFTLRTVRELHDHGLLHRKLVNRVRFFTLLSLFMLSLVAYHTARGELVGLYVLICATLGFALGYYVFHRSANIIWDPEREVIRLGKLDLVGTLILLLYLGLDYGLRLYLEGKYPGTYAATGYLLALLGAILFGRSTAILLRIKNVAKSVQTDISSEHTG